MPSEPPAGELKPITPARIAQELIKLTSARRSGEFTPATYDQRFARMIRELNERRIDGDRAAVHAALLPLVEQNTISRMEFERLVKQLGME